jgi:hypothetical protein
VRAIRLPSDPPRLLGYEDVLEKYIKQAIRECFSGDIREAIREDLRKYFRKIIRDGFGGGIREGFRKCFRESNRTRNVLKFLPTFGQERSPMTLDSS